MSRPNPSSVVLISLLPWLVVCAGEAEPTPVGSEAPVPVVVSEPPPRPSDVDVDVVSSDGDWKTFSVFRGAYQLEFPQSLEWKLSRKKGYASYQANTLHEGRIYTVWVHRYPVGSAEISDPNLVDDGAAAFGLVHGVPTPPRMDFLVAGGKLSGRAVRFEFKAKDGGRMYNDLVVFKVKNDLVYLSITAKGGFAPIADFRRMCEGFRVVE